MILLALLLVGGAAMFLLAGLTYALCVVAHTDD